MISIEGYRNSEAKDLELVPILVTLPEQNVFCQLLRLHLQGHDAPASRKLIVRAVTQNLEWKLFADEHYAEEHEIKSVKVFMIQVFSPSWTYFSPFFYLTMYIEGPIDVNMSEISMEEIHHFFSKDPTIRLGGHWKPRDCLPRWKVSWRVGNLLLYILKCC